MQPERRLILDLHHQCTADDDRACQHDDENGGPIASIDESIVQSADVASRAQAEETGEELSLSAARTFAGKPARYALQERRFTRRRSNRRIHRARLITWELSRGPDQRGETCAPRRPRTKRAARGRPFKPTKRKTYSAPTSRPPPVPHT